MHFRERGHVVQLIRTVYDADTKKGKSEVVGRLQKGNPQVSEELKAILTADERKEVAVWIQGHAATEGLKKQLAVRTLPEQMALAGEWFAQQKGKKNDDAHVMAAALVTGWTQLRMILKRNGLIE